MSEKRLTNEKLTELKQELAEREYYSLTCGDIIQILIDGCTGYDKMHEDEIISLADQAGLIDELEV